MHKNHIHSKWGQKRAYPFVCPFVCLLVTMLIGLFTNKNLIENSNSQDQNAVAAKETLR